MGEDQTLPLVISSYVLRLSFDYLLISHDISDDTQKIAHDTGSDHSHRSTQLRQSSPSRKRVSELIDIGLLHCYLFIAV